jgi:hypothetical protein
MTGLASREAFSPSAPVHDGIVSQKQIDKFTLPLGSVMNRANIEIMRPNFAGHFPSIGRKQLYNFIAKARSSLDIVDSWMTRASIGQNIQASLTRNTIPTLGSDE